MILMNDFKLENKKNESELLKVFTEFLRSGYYILGSKTAEFESVFANYIGTKYAVGVANGLEALQIALLAYDIGPGDEVITVANTAIATTLSILQVGATPVFVDIDEYYSIDVKQVEKAITPRTKAILPVDIFGQTVDWTGLRKIAKQHQVLLIEDACQAFGATYGTKKAGNLGDIGCFSFYPTKNLGAYGDGGAITTNSKVIYEKCLMLRNYGQSKRYYHDVIGINSRLDELQAALLLEKMKTIDKALSHRRNIADYYFQHLAGIPQIILPKVRANAQHAYHLFVIQAQQRDQLQAYLKTKGIESLIHYPVPLHQQKALQPNQAVLPVTERVAQNILSLPMNPLLTQTELKKVCTAIRTFYQDQIPTVSIGIPAYNEEKSIGQLLTGLVKQDQTLFKLKEIIVNSDGSDDRTVAIVTALAKKYPLIKIMHDGLRKGQAERLNELYRQCSGDIFMTFDADVTLAHHGVINALVKPFQDSEVTLVGGNNVPSQPHIFFQKAVTTYELAWRSIINSINNGDNVHNNPGCISAVRSRFVKANLLPAGVVANDHYLYLQVVTQGKKFRFAPDALVYYKVPDNFSDFFQQTARFLRSGEQIGTYFKNAEKIEQEYTVPLTNKVIGYAKFLRTQPLSLMTALILQITQRLTMPLYASAGKSILWKRIVSSK